MLLTEGLNDQLFGSDLDHEEEPRHIQTEPFEFADDGASCNDNGEEAGLKFISDMDHHQHIKLKLVSAIERETDGKLNEDALDFNELIGQEGYINLKQAPG